MAYALKNGIRYGLKFTKEDSIKFIGHLDLLKIFERAFMRSGLPMKYSQGFNPHQLISMASPLSLGMTSSAEYAEAEFTKEVPEEEIRAKLNPYLPEGVKVLFAFRLAEGEKIGMGQMAAALYTIDFKNLCTEEFLKENLPKYMALPQIITEKKTKRGIKETDIRPDIFEACIHADDPRKMDVLLAAGSRANLKPEVFAKGLFAYFGGNFSPNKLLVERKEIYRQKDNKFVPFKSGE